MLRLSALWLAAATAVVAASCSSPSGPPKKACFPVKGQVFAGTQPAAGAMVVFHPDGSAPDDWPEGFPRGQVRSDGSFELSTYGENDGAPAGSYSVLITWTQGAGSEETEDTQMIDRLKGKYKDPASSKLKATINSGPTEVPPIRLP